MIRYADISAPAASPRAPKARRVAAARKAAAETENRRKRGRPAKSETKKPWVAAGVSRAAYYRKRKG